jgi:hypothetical protein
MRILWIGLEHDLGIEHEVLIMNKHNWNEQRLLEFNPEVAIEREFNDAQYRYDSEWEFIAKNLPQCKRTCWFIDTHVSYDRHREYIKHFHYSFFAIHKYAFEFNDYTPSFWLPTCFPLATMPKVQEKVYEIGYVGRFNVPYLEIRTKFLADIFEVFGDKCHFVTDYNTVYETMGKCKIMLNLSYMDDMNFRTFESLACGCTLLTNPVPDIQLISGLSKRIHTFRGTDDCIEKIKGLLDKPVVNNRKFIEQSHLLSHRVTSLLSMLSTKQQELI